MMLSANMYSRHVQAIGVGPFISAGPGRLPLRVRQVKIRRCKSRARACFQHAVFSLFLSLSLRSDSCWRCRVKPRSRNRTARSGQSDIMGILLHSGMQSAFCTLNKCARARARPCSPAGQEGKKPNGVAGGWAGCWNTAGFDLHTGRPMSLLRGSPRSFRQNYAC